MNISSQIAEACSLKPSKGTVPVERGRRPRIGLISPYTGGNLGDAAIIEATRAHLERRLPNAEFVLIVLDPERVSGVHGLPSFPLTAVRRSFYFTPNNRGSGNVLGGNAYSGHDRGTLSLRTWSLFKKVASCIPFALPLARRVRDASQAIALEGHHLREAARVVRNLDGLVVAGGGQFDDEFGGALGHPYAVFKWISLAHRQCVPVFFAGVGVCEVNTKLTGWLLRRAIAKSGRISLRDEGSIGILGRLGISKDLSLCPDLAFALPEKNTGRYPLGQRGPQLHIGFSPIAFGRLNSWPTNDTASFDRYWEECKTLAADLVQAGYRVTLFATDDSDIALAEELYEHLMEIAPGNEQLRLLSTSNLPELISALPSFDAVIAGRLHGVLLSHISGVPVVAVSYHRKVRAHMEDMGQDKFCLDFERFDALMARASLTQLLVQRGVIMSDLRRLCAARYKAVETEFAIIGQELSQKCASS